MVRQQRPPSQAWRTFPNNHLKDLASIDFFVLPTATFRVLFVFLVPAHDRWRALHFNVTARPSARWTAQQLVEACPWDTAARFLLRDRDSMYGEYFRLQVKGIGVSKVLIDLRSPWQNANVERLIGSIRRECLDHVIVWNESSLRRILNSYFEYSQRSRTHLALGQDTPQPRAVQPPDLGAVVQFSQVGGLHHRYERRMA